MAVRTQDIIAAKRDGRELSRDEISRIVLDYASGQIPDYQMSAFLMAAYIQGLSFPETSALTQAMVDSGSRLDLSRIHGVKVDKHSTGGVGDKTTLVLVPMLAALGLKVPKMSGRGLGFTGGTLDKLESIPGFDTALGIDRFVAQVDQIGAAIAGQTADIVPADRKIYALRDVTATVDSIPLIAASIMSKKIACSSDMILLDVKAGSGAFMSSIKDARKLARTMIAIGRELGREMAAAITDMNQPLGDAVGNALEVEEAIETLKGSGPDRFRALCVELCAILLCMAKHCSALDEGREAADAVLKSGAALEKFGQIVRAQGGDARVVEDASLLPRAGIVREVRSRREGRVAGINAAGVGRAASVLGAGRELREDCIDPAVGVVVKKGLGESVARGETLAVVYANKAEVIAEAESLISRSYLIGAQVKPRPLVHEILY